MMSCSSRAIRSRSSLDLSPRRLLGSLGACVREVHAKSAGSAEPHSDCESEHRDERIPSAVRRAAAPPQQRKATERHCGAQHHLPRGAGDRHEVAAEHEQERQRTRVVTEQPQHCHGDHADQEGCRRPAPTPRVRHGDQDQQQHEEPVAGGVPVERIAYRRRPGGEPADCQERQRDKGINDAL